MHLLELSVDSSNATMSGKRFLAFGGREAGGESSKVEDESKGREDESGVYGGQRRGRWRENRGALLPFPFPELFSKSRQALLAPSVCLSACIY